MCSKFPHVQRKVLENWLFSKAFYINKDSSSVFSIGYQKWYSPRLQAYTRHMLLPVWTQPKCERLNGAIIVSSFVAQSGSTSAACLKAQKYPSLTGYFDWLGERLISFFRSSAPSAVPTMHLHGSTGSSMSLSWEPPKQPNGIILDYEIKYFEKVKPVFVCGDIILLVIRALALFIQAGILV